MPDITVRLLDPSDLPALRDLAELTFRAAWQVDNDPEEFEQYCSDNLTEEKLAAEMDEPNAEFYFAEIDDAPVAYLKLNIAQMREGVDDPRPVQIERIYVHPDYQGQGIGEQLLTFAEQRGRDIGARWLWLSVWQKAPRTIRFYENNGFRIFGIETFWVGNDPQPDWVMKREIL